MKKRKKSIDKSTGAGYYSTVLARLAQLVEHMLDVHGVTGSSPVPRTKIGKYRMVLADFTFSLFTIPEASPAAIDPTSGSVV